MVYIKDLLLIFYYEMKLSLAKAVEFRSDFLFGMLSDLVFSFFAPIFQLLIYTKTNGYPGWSLDQLLLYQAILLTWQGTVNTLFGGIPYYIGIVAKYGLFDRLLLTPYPTLGLLLTRGFNQKSLGTLLAGLIGMIIIIYKYNFNISLINLILFLFYFGIATIFYVSMLILYSIINLKLIYADRLRSIFDNIIFLSNFPAEVFSGGLRVVYLFVIPIAAWVYFPTQALLGRLNNYSIYGAISTIIILWLSVKLWIYQTKKYTSAGG